MPALNSTVGFLISLGLIRSKIIGQTEFGNIEGISSTGRDGRVIYEFLGIPYAHPPIDELRFSPPVEWNSSWDGIRSAKKFGSNCKQFHLFRKSVMGSEDCLFLNVYTHRYKKEDVSSDQFEAIPLSPVIVYIHGGLFMHGSGDLYKPKYMLDSDIVLVTVNYRLGVLGFLNLEAEDIRGNQGLKDQVVALKWVQRNIANFGGDPNLVTIMGESAGGACVHYHMLSPLSQGLFHRAISQSGNAFVSWASQDHPQHQAILLANELGCKNLTMGEIAKCLRDLDSDKISESQRSASDLLHDRYALYAPTIELPGDDAFISDLPQNIIQSGHFAKVPWMVGANTEEGLIYSAPIIRNETIRAELNKNWSHWAPILFRFSDHPNHRQIADQIWEYYMGNKSSEIGMDTLHNITTFLSDRSFFEGLHNSLTLHRGQHPIFPYIYAYEGKFSVGKLLLGMNFKLPVIADVMVSQGRKWFQTKILRRTEKSYGVAHGDELPLLFKMPLQPELKKKAKPDGDLIISKVLVATWGAFAKDGTPPPIFNTSWPQLLSLNSANRLHSASGKNLTDNKPSQENYRSPIKFLKINLTTEIVDEPFHERVNFWRKLNLLPFERPTSARIRDNADECSEVDNNNIVDCNDEEKVKGYWNFNLENVYTLISFMKNLFG